MEQVGGKYQRITEWMVISQLRVEGLDPPDQQVPETVAAGQVFVARRSEAKTQNSPRAYTVQDFFNQIALRRIFPCR